MLDLCHSDPCNNGGICELLNDTVSFVCICPPGYIGSTCEISDPCYFGPCNHGGICEPLLSGTVSFECICPPGYSGPTCEASGKHIELSDSSFPYSYCIYAIVNIQLHLYVHVYLEIDGSYLTPTQALAHL